MQLNIHQLGSSVPVPTSAHSNITTHVPNELATAMYVFIRHDSHRGPLQRLYEVFSPDDKVFCIRIGIREELIPIDRLKPAHVSPAITVPVAQPPRTIILDRTLDQTLKVARAGRQVR